MLNHTLKCRSSLTIPQHGNIVVSHTPSDACHAQLALGAGCEGARADLIASSLGEAVKLCMQETGVEGQRQAASKMENSTTAAA